MKNGRIIILGDCHHPNVDKRAWRVTLEVLAGTEHDAVVQSGDFADMEAVSAHAKRFGYVPDFKRELEKVAQAGEDLEQACGDSPLTLVLGNHDLWLPKYVSHNAPQVESLIPDFHELYGFTDEVTIVPYQKVHFIGKVGFVHDQGFCGKTATRQTLDAVGHCIVHGHDHRATIVYGGTTDGDRWVGMGVGWLGDERRITYAPPSRTKEWQKGLGILDYVDGVAYAQFVPWVKNRFVVEGKVFK